jgi:hypothetical protein
VAAPLPSPMAPAMASGAAVVSARLIFMVVPTL